jgi:FdhD protein
MSQTGRAPTHAAAAVDEQGRAREVSVAGELPLTLVVDDREIVTMMTLGTHPKAQPPGFLRNRRLIDELEGIVAVEVDWGRLHRGREHRRRRLTDERRASRTCVNDDSR